MLPDSALRRCSLISFWAVLLINPAHNLKRYSVQILPKAMQLNSGGATAQFPWLPMYPVLAYMPVLVP
jgi:hypothetical protein